MRKIFLNLTILIIGIFLIVNLTRSIADLLGAGDKIKEAEERLAKVRFKNDELKKRLAEVQSPFFLEKSAREKLGLAKEGEIVVILPSFKPIIELKPNEDNLPNWQKWWRLFF